MLTNGTKEDRGAHILSLNPTVDVLSNGEKGKCCIFADGVHSRVHELEVQKAFFFFVLKNIEEVVVIFFVCDDCS